MLRGDRPARRGGLHHALAAPARRLGPRDLDHLELRGDQVDELADILAHDRADRRRSPGRSRRGRARAARGGVPSATRGRRRGLGASAGSSASTSVSAEASGSAGSAAQPSAEGDLQVLERQLELLDLALDPLRARPEALPLQLDDPRLQGLDQQVVGAQRRRQTGVLGLERGDQRAQLGRVGWQGVGHGRSYQIHGARDQQNNDFQGARGRQSSGIAPPPDPRPHPTRAGGAPQCGRRQSMPSHSMDI